MNSAEHEKLKSYNLTMAECLDSDLYSVVSQINHDSTTVNTSKNKNIHRINQSRRWKTYPHQKFRIDYISTPSTVFLIGNLQNQIKKNGVKLTR